MDKSKDKTKASIIRDWIVLVFIILLLPSFLFAIFEGIVQVNYNTIFVNLLISVIMIYSGFKYVKSFFADSLHNNQSQRFYNNPQLRNRLLILLAITVVIWGWYLSMFLAPIFNTQNNLETWVQFTSNDRSFSVSLPKTPELLPSDTGDTSDIKIRVYVSASQDGQVVYSIRKVDLPTQYRDLDPLSLLEKVSLDLWSDSSTTILEKRQGKINGYDTLDFKLSKTSDGKAYYTTVRSIWDGKAVYEIMMGTTKQDVSEFNKILESFRIN